MKFFIFSLFFVFLIGFVCAGFEVGDLSHSILKEYGPGENIQGWVNLSLNNEPTNSLFSDLRGNSISLIKLLKQNNGFDYSCNIEDCESDYSSKKGETLKSFELDAGETTLVGFKLDGLIDSIISVNFTFRSNAEPSCFNQLQIDILNDGTNELGNTQSFDYECTSRKGCFNENKETRDYGFQGTTPYCQRIKLSESPSFKIGAWVKREGVSNELEMSIYDGTTRVASCDLGEISDVGAEVTCDVDYLVTEQRDFYVCISAKTSGGNKIRGYTSGSNLCGFYGLPIQEERAAYDIVAKGKQFDSVGTIDVTNNLPSGETFSAVIQDYLSARYGSSGGDIDCVTTSCIVPLKFISGENQDTVQTVRLTDLKISYLEEGPTSENKFYELDENPAKVNSDFQKLFLDYGNFSVQENFGNTTFQLKLKNVGVFSEPISIERIPTVVSLSPMTVAAAYPTEFVVLVDQHNSNNSIANYVWDFGNGDADTTTTNKATYTYNSTGKFDLSITITDSRGFSSSKTFEIEVEIPIKVANELLTKKREYLNKIKTQISEFARFHQLSLNSTLNISNLESTLIVIQELNASANSDEDYIEIVSALFELEIPESIAVEKRADSVTFFPNENEIDLDVLKAIGGGDYEDRSRYVEAILAWNQENVDTKITFKEFTAKYGGVNYPFLRIFEISINDKKLIEESFYFVVEDLDNLMFKEDYSQRENSGFIYTQLSLPQTISFSTTEEADFVTLPAFISPGLSDLVIGSQLDEEGMSKWVMFILIMVLLIALGFATYIFLQKWYKNKYEKHLFKKKNDLYNMVSYVASEKKKGSKEGDIKSKLKKSGWNSEQVNYVMKKYAGKRTGMLELPIQKILGKTKTPPSPKRKRFDPRFRKKY